MNSWLTWAWGVGGYLNLKFSIFMRKSVSVMSCFTLLYRDYSVCNVRLWGFPGVQCKESRQCRRCWDSGSFPGSGRSPGEESDNSLQYSCLENPMDHRAYWATVGVAQVRTPLNNWAHTQRSAVTLCFIFEAACAKDFTVSSPYLGYKVSLRMSIWNQNKMEQFLE